MRIGVDARIIGSRLTGIGHYLAGVFAALAGVTTAHEFVLYLGRPPVVPVPDRHWHVRVSNGMHTLGPLWLQLHGARLARQDRLDIFWGTHLLLPPRLPQRVRTVLTVHDLVPFFHAQTMRFTSRLVYRLLGPSSLRRAGHVAAISHTVASELQQFFDIPPERITVVPPGVAGSFRQLDREAAAAHVAQRFGLDRPYLLNVGTLEPRKNIHTLLRAVARLPASLRKDVVLVVVGMRGWKTSPLEPVAAPLIREGTLRFLGYVTDADLPWLYSGALAFVFPSLYEGFGLPVIEAMACGTPVVASDIPIMHEVAGNAAVFVPPLDVGAWQQAITQLVGDPDLRMRLAAAGVVRASRFSYEDSARRILGIFEMLAS